MTTTYAAHVVTADASDLGDPEIIVMTDSDENGAADPIISYPYPPNSHAWDILAEHGWRVIEGGKGGAVQRGYVIVNVEAHDYERIVKEVTFAKAQADIEAARQDTSWRTAIRDAMHDGGSATRLAAAGGISRERVYQIRDDRR